LQTFATGMNEWLLSGFALSAAKGGNGRVAAKPLIDRLLPVGFGRDLSKSGLLSGVTTLRLCHRHG
jgi:hypothetical protein